MTDVLSWILFSLVMASLGWFVLQLIPNRVVQSFGVIVGRLKFEIKGKYSDSYLAQDIVNILTTANDIRFRLFQEGTVFVERLPSTSQRWGRISFHYPSFHLMVSIRSRVLATKTLVNPLATLVYFLCIVGGPLFGALYFSAVPLVVAMFCLVPLPGIALLFFLKTRHDGEELARWIVSKLAGEESVRLKQASNDDFL